MKLGAVILAAGYSSRMDGFKPLMQLGGETLLSRVIHLFMGVGVDRPVVVTGHRHQETEAEARRCGAEPLYNKNFAQGMFSSVCAAGEFFQNAAHTDQSGKKVDGFFLLPVDIPLIRPVTLQVLRDAFDGTSILHPVRDGLRGHPPLIPGYMLPEILAHDGSGGLKAVLERHSAQEIPVWDDGPFMDADTRVDFTRLEARFEQMAQGSQAEITALADLSMPTKGVAHGRAVAQVAVRFAEELNKQGFSLDRGKVLNSALLHDIAKGQPQHETAGAQLVRAYGLSDLAEPIGAHRDALPVPAEQLSEKELVCLADKLVRGTQRLSIEKRFQEKLAIYEHDREACAAIMRRLGHALQLQQAVEFAARKPLDAILAPLTGLDTQPQ